MTPAKNKTIYVSLRTWGRFFWPFVDVEGGLPPVRAESVINNNSSQTSRTSESIFLPGESTSPVRLEVLRVLGLRPFILHNCDWLENSKPICKHRSSNAAALHDHNCFEICYLHILVDDLQYHMKCRISLVTSMQVPQDHIELPWPRFLIWKIRTCTIQSAPPLKLFAPKQQRYCILMVKCCVYMQISIRAIINTKEHCETSCYVTDVVSYLWTSCFVHVLPVSSNNNLFQPDPSKIHVAQIIYKLSLNFL